MASKVGIKTLPPSLDTYLFAELGAEYRPKGKNLQMLNASHKENIGYLGSYFPRSFVESWSIFSELFAQKQIREAFQKKERIDIFDLGAGQGASVLGILYALAERGFSQPVVVHAIDGNEDALKFLAQILNWAPKLLSEASKNGVAAKLSVHPQSFRFDHDANKFAKQLGGLVAASKRKHKVSGFDIITTSKFLGELRTVAFQQGASQSPQAAKEASRGFYSQFLNKMGPHMSTDALLLLLDIKKGNGELTTNTSEALTAESSWLMSTSGKGPLGLLLPHPCRMHLKTCNSKYKCALTRRFKVLHSGCAAKKSGDNSSEVSYRVFCPVAMLSNLKLKESPDGLYDINEDNMTCQAGDLQFYIPQFPPENMQNAYSFAED